MLADAGRQFTADRCTSARIRACRDRAPDYDAAVWREMAELGWLSVLAPEADGGLGSGLGEMGQLAYEWGAGCGAEPLVATGTLAITLLVDSDGPVRATLLASTMQGDAVPAVAWIEAGGCCESTHGGWQVSGSARFVTPADATDFLVVFPPDSGHPALRVAAASPGLSVRREQRVDGTASALLELENLQVPESNLLAGSATAAHSSVRCRRRSTAGPMRSSVTCWPAKY